MSDRNDPVDKRLVRKAFDKAVSTYDEAAVLQREVAERVLERLDYLKIKPEVILDIGSGTGFCTSFLNNRYTDARVISLDVSEHMLGHARSLHAHDRNSFVCADAEQLPFADKSVDFIFSNLTLQWCSDLAHTFSEFRRVLRTNGLVMFSTFGPDTLGELRASWQSVDDYEHVNRFVDLHIVGDALVAAGMGDVVMDNEYITVTYREVKTLMKDLKDIGAHNVTTGRQKTITGKQHLKKMIEAYEEFRNDGVLPATYEVVYGHAWALENIKVKGPTEVRVPVQSLNLKMFTQDQDS